MSNFRGQYVGDAKSLGVIAVDSEINHVVGNTVTKLTKPNKKTILVMEAEVGNFRYKVGDVPGLTATAPASTVSNGSGSKKISEGKEQAIAAPKEVTVIGDGAGAILTYYWL